MLKGGSAKTFTDPWSRFLARRQDSETASIEQVEIIPENRERRCIISKGKYGQRSEGGGREEQDGLSL